MNPALVVAVIAGVATPAQHQRAATALYQVLTHYDAAGRFVGVAREDATEPSTDRVTGVLTLGSAFAVSRDGWLMTARHVVDPERKLEDLCVRLGNEWAGLVMLHRVSFTIVFEDIAGARYGTVVTIRPTAEEGNLCLPGGIPSTVSYDGTTNARIRAFDTVADLALVIIDASPVSALDLAPVRPARWADVFAIGYTDPGTRTVFSGSVARRCEETDDGCIMLSDGELACTMVRVMRTTAPVVEGMSGSPQISGGRVVGITTMRANDVPVGFAVPSPYAWRWYRHVRWPAAHPRPPTVCDLTPEH